MGRNPGRQSAEYRLPQQPDQEVPSVLAGACLSQSLATACRQSEHSSNSR